MAGLSKCIINCCDMAFDCSDDYEYPFIIRVLLFILAFIGILLIFSVIIVPLGTCLSSRDYYSVYTNTTLPEGIVLNNVPCAFKFTGENNHCHLIFDNIYNRTIIHMNGFYYQNMMGILYVNYNNLNYNQLTNGFQISDIHKESYRICSIQSPTGI